jgi:hypothetical protein
MNLETASAAHHAAPHTAFNLPDERVARIAERRAFVALKLCFMRAAADVPGPHGALLQRHVRAASEPAQLWRLRAAVFASLHAGHERTPMHQAELRRQLDGIFADSSFGPDGSPPEGLFSAS